MTLRTFLRLAFSGNGCTFFFFFAIRAFLRSGNEAAPPFQLRREDRPAHQTPAADDRHSAQRKEEDFQLFLSLLDSDRFYGKFRDGVHKVNTVSTSCAEW